MKIYIFGVLVVLIIMLMIAALPATGEEVPDSFIYYKCFDDRTQDVMIVTDGISSIGGHPLQVTASAVGATMIELVDRSEHMVYFNKGCVGRYNLSKPEEVKF